MLEPESIRVRDLHAAGVSRHEIASRRPAPFWGIRSSGLPRDLLERARQFRPRLGDAFYSHVTAARLWGIPLPRGLAVDERLHVAFARGHRAPSAAQLVGHEIAVEDGDVALAFDVALTSPARTWRDLSSLLTVEHLVAAGDAILHAGLATGDELRRAIAARGFRGRRRALEAVELLDGGAESPPESLLRLAVIRAGLPAVLANHEIFDARGVFVARPDLTFRDHPVAIEYDGDGHRSDPRQWQRDVERYAALQDAGIDVIRATALDLPWFPRTIARARARLAHHGWRA